MAHSYNDNGTIYEVGGGKFNDNGTVYEIDHGKYNDNGTVYEITFGPVVLIAFRVHGGQNAIYNAEEGMTWTEFVNSEYAPKSENWKISGNRVTVYGFPIRKNNSSGAYVSPGNVIADGGVYYAED